MDEMEELNDEAHELLEAGSRKRLASVVKDMGATIKKRRKVLILVEVLIL